MLIKLIQSRIIDKFFFSKLKFILMVLSSILLLACEEDVSSKDIHPLDVPTGLPGDSFNITEIKGDSWRILDSGVGLHSGRKQFYWVDDETVLFSGNNVGHYKSHKQKKEYPFSSYIYRWNLTEGITRFIDERSAYAFCYYAGKIKAYIEIEQGNEKVDKKIFRIYEGPLDNLEKSIYRPMSGRIKVAEGQNFSPYSETCMPRKRPAMPIRNNVKPLLPQDGYLDIGEDFFPSKTKNIDNVRFWNPETGLDVKLPFTVREMGLGKVKFYPFNGAYFIAQILGPKDGWSGKEDWRESNCLPAWWLWPEGGETEKLCIPYFEMEHYGPIKIIPSAKGLIVVSWAGSGPNHIAESGIYLLREGHYQKLVAGWIRLDNTSNISPDGCRIAFGYSPNKQAMKLVGRGPSTTRILDLCS